MKQARAFGVGVVLATQNPMDLDYRALGNAGVWCLGRLQTDADRARVVDGLGGASSELGHDLNRTLQRLAPRCFLLRDVHSEEGLALLQPRWATSWLRGPMTRRCPCGGRLKFVEVVTQADRAQELLARLTLGTPARRETNPFGLPGLHVSRVVPSHCRSIPFGPSQVFVAMDTSAERRCLG